MLTPASIYLLKVKTTEVLEQDMKYSKITIKTPERRHWSCSGVFIVNFEHISHLLLVISQN